MAHGCFARPARRRASSLLASVIERLEPRQLFSVGGGFVGAGLSGQYFNNTSLSGTPAFTRTDVRIDSTWNGVTPAGSTSPGFVNVSGTNWSAKWTGQIIPRYSETYTFTTVSDDGVRLVVNGQAVINNWTDHSPTTDTGSINLVAGQAYSIELDYFQAGGGTTLHLLWSSASTAQEVIEPATPIGINAGTAADYDNSLMFADVVKMSRGWTSVQQPWGNTITSDPSAWPTADAALPLFDAPYRAGTYALTFNGSATVSTNGSYSGVSLSNQKYDPVTNTSTVTLTLSTDGSPGAGQSALALIFTNTRRTASSDTNTGITNVTLMRPSTDGSNTPLPAGTLFTPQYEALISNFTTIRYMDYLHTNGSTIHTWADRTLPADITQNQTNGGSLEYAVELANQTGKDLWINVPFAADNDYVTKLADLLKYGSDGVNPYTSTHAHPVYPPLNSGLKVYVEYSNENWNYNPTQSNAAGTAAALAGDPINYDNLYPTGDPGGWILAQRYVAERSMQISNLFRGVYGDSAMPGTSADATVRPLFEWQYGGNWGQVGLDFINNFYNDADGMQHVSTPHAVNYFFWGGGGGWYSGVQNGNADSIDGLFNSGLSVATSVISDAKLATQFGLKDVGYEGGFELGNDSPTDMQIQATVDPRAQQLTLDTVNAFFADGGDLPVVYTASGAAHFNYSVAQDATGATDIFSQDTPKMEAYLAAEQSLPAENTVAHALPATDGSTLQINEGDIYTQFNNQNVASYILSAPAAGTYTVTLEGAAGSSNTKEHLMLDGVVLGTVSLPLWSTVTNVGDASVLSFTVDAAGIYGLSVYHDGPNQSHFSGNLQIARTELIPGQQIITDFPAAIANVASAGTASDSTTAGQSSSAANAFDGSSSTDWSSSGTNAWLQYQFADNSAQAVTTYSMTSSSDSAAFSPANWEVVASDDGVHWTTLDARSNQNFADTHSTNTYTIANPGNFNFYRLNILDNSGTVVQLADWSLFADPAAATKVTLPPSPALLTGGKAFASSDNAPTEGAAQAFDQNNSTKWMAFTNTGFLAYRTDTANVVTQYSLTSGNDEPKRDPKTWKIIASNDGIHWTTIDSQSNQSFSARGQTLTYTMANTTAYTYYAIKITANNGSDCLQLAEFSLYTDSNSVPPAVPNLLTGGTATASSQNAPWEGAAQAFDQLTTTKWLAFSPTAWLQTKAAPGQAFVVTNYSLTSANDDYGRDPRDWNLLASNDGIHWTTLDSQSNQSFTDRFTTNNYITGNTTAYKFYRLNITANDGGGYTQLADLSLYGSTITA